MMSVWEESKTISAQWLYSKLTVDRVSECQCAVHVSVFNTCQIRVRHISKRVHATQVVSADILFRIFPVWRFAWVSIDIHINTCYYARPHFIWCLCLVGMTWSLNSLPIKYSVWVHKYLILTKSGYRWNGSLIIFVKEFNVYL
jgi:hypothetical protein